MVAKMSPQADLVCGLCHVGHGGGGRPPHEVVGLHPHRGHRYHGAKHTNKQNNKTESSIISITIIIISRTNIMISRTKHNHKQNQAQSQA